MTWIGSLPGWATLVTLAVVGYYVIRGGGGQALGTLETANRILGREIDRLKVEVADQQKIIAGLEATRSLESIVEQVVMQFDAQRQRADARQEQVLTWVHTHEQHAQERHEAQMRLTETVVQAVKKESNS